MRVFYGLFVFLMVSGIHAQTCNQFLDNLDVIGAGSPDPSAAFSSNTFPYCGTEGEYPSPHNVAEMSSGPFSQIHCPGAPNYRGLDASYHVVVGGNFTVPTGGGAEVEGRLVVGGDLEINNALYGISESGGGTFVIGAEGNALVVENNISGSGTLNLGSNNIGGNYVAYSGGTNTLNVGNGNVSANNATIPVDHAALLSQATTISTNMKNATPTASWNYAFSVATITGTNAAQEVVNITAADLANNGELKFADIAPGAVIIINVSGANVNSALIARAGRTADPIYTTSGSDPDALIFNVVWNFHEATSLTTSNDLNGLVLLPNGSLTLNNNLNGRAYVGGDLTHAGAGTEIHNFPFLGDLSSFCPSCGTPRCGTVTVTKNTP